MNQATWFRGILLFPAVAGSLAAQETGATVIPVLPTTPDKYWWADRFDPVRFNNSSASHYFVKDPNLAASYHFFPPEPPVLGSEIPLFGPLIANGPPAPPELAAFSNDVFYPMLGSVLLAGELPRPLLAELQSYRTERIRLQDELRAKLTNLHDAPRARRVQELAALAEKQAAPIRALFERADRIRSELLRLAPTVAPAQRPAVPAGTLRRGDREDSDSVTLQLEAEATAYAAYYEPGLTSTQRRLLREAAHEIVLAARGTSDRGRGQILSFFPESARVPLPATLPADCAAKIASFAALKAEAKAELREVLRRHPAGSARSEAFHALAAREASRLQELEKTAEEIRGALDTGSEPGESVREPTLPPALAARIAAYRQRRSESLQTLHALLAGPAKPGAEPASVAAFNRTQETLVSELNRENAAIRQAIAEHERAGGRAGDRKSIDDLIRDFEKARLQQETSVRYRDYRAAVLLPGLSPGQRQLLFDAAMEQLAMPLPAGQRLQ